MAIFNFGGAILAGLLGYLVASVAGAILNPILNVIIGGTITPIGFALLAGLFGLFGISVWGILGKAQEYGAKGGKKWMELLGQHGKVKVIALSLLIIVFLRYKALDLNPLSAALPRWIIWILNKFGVSGTILTTSVKPPWSYYTEIALGIILFVAGFTPYLGKLKDKLGITGFPFLGKAVGASEEIAGLVENFKKDKAVNGVLRDYLSEYTQVLKLLEEEKKGLRGEYSIRDYHPDPRQLEEEIAKMIQAEGGFSEAAKETLKKAGVVTDDIEQQVGFVLTHYRKKKGIKLR